MFNQIINSPNLLNFILPIFLADEDMRSDDEMYDKVPEKLIMELKSYTMPPLKIWKKVNFLLIRTMTNMIT